MQELGPATGELNDEAIAKQYDADLKTLIKQSNDPFFQSERVLMINEARFNWLAVDKNMHFGVPGMVSTPYGSMLDWVPFDNLSDSSGSETTGGPDFRLAFPVALISGDCWKFCAVMGSNAPRVKGVPDDVHDSESVHAAHNADVNIRDLWIKNKIDRKWRRIAFHQFTTGPAYVRTFWNTDASKYGETEEPEINVTEDDQGNPMPQVVGTKKYANGDAEISIHSILEVSHPYEAKGLDDCGWFQFECMRSKWELLDKYAGDDDNPGPLYGNRDVEPANDDDKASTTIAAEAVESTATPSGTGRPIRPNFWRWSELWLKPHLFQSIQSSATRKLFKDHYPDGIWIARVNSKIVEIGNRKLNEDWVPIPVGRGERLMERPIVSDVMPIQRAIDDLVGMAQETVLRAITQTIMDSGLIDREAANKREAVPAEIILTMLPVDGDLQKRIFQIPPAHLSDQVRPLIEYMRQLMTDIDGVRPELSGGGAPTQTFREAKQRKDQALAQLAPQAQAMTDGAEDIAVNLVKLRAKFGAGTVKAQNKSAYGSKTDIVDIAQLKVDNWHAESDDQFPLTVSDQRDTLFSLLKEFPPEVQQALSILDPINIEEICELLQIPGFESAIQDQKEKTLADIQQLLLEQPIPGAPGPNGQPGPPQPSRPIDVFNNHVVVAALLSKWLVANHKVQHQNPGGFANVVAAFMAETQAAGPPPPPPPPPPLKGAVSLALKLEDMPNLVPEVLKAAGVDIPPPPPAPTPGPSPQQGPVQTPPPIGGAPAQESPIPPLPPQAGSAPAGVPGQ